MSSSVQRDPLDLDAIAERAHAIYEFQLRAKLEPAHVNEFVAIDTETGAHFLGRSMSDASRAARHARPEAIPFLIRIGHDTAIHIGGTGAWKGTSTS